MRGPPQHRSRLSAPAGHTRGWALHDADVVAMGRGNGFDRANRSAGWCSPSLPVDRSRGRNGRRRRARPLRLFAHQIRRPSAVAPLPELRQGLPEDLWPALFPVPAVLPACDTPRSTQSPISALPTEPARLPSACTTSGAVPPRTNTTSRRNRRACAGHGSRALCQLDDVNAPA